MMANPASDKKSRDFLRGFVHRILRRRARGSEDRDAFFDRGERVETLDELAHDSHYAPWVRGREVSAGARLLKQLFIFGDR